MGKEFDDATLIKEMDFYGGMFQRIGNGIFLTNREIEILERYKIPYQKCKSLKEILYSIEDFIANMDIIDEELDFVSSSISERDYYQNTNQ